jgi:3-oxoacyl-[acyl-carrier protein] reductase
MKMELRNKVAIVTGAAQGLGQAIALTLAREGAKIVVGDINLEKAKEVVEEIRAQGEDAIAVKVDVSQKQNVERMVNAAISKFGQIDILVNCAGICSLSPILEIEEEEWDKILAVNLKGTFLCSQAVFREMVKRKSGKIVNISSASAKMGGIVVGAHYSASKAGIICFTKSLALSAAPYKINVNCVCPGPQKTEMTDVWGDKINTKFKNMIPWKEYGKPQDIAEAVLFLVSAKARYITGEILDVNGGLVMD